MAREDRGGSRFLCLDVRPRGVPALLPGPLPVRPVALMAWRVLFGGPKCGATVPFPDDEPFLPVSRDSRKDDVDLYRIGQSLHDWTGELVGHYWLSDKTDRTEFLPLPDSVRGLYTKFRHTDQADGDED